MSDIKEKDIFVSYSRTDIEWVIDTTKLTDPTDYKLWWDGKLKGGDIWWDKLCEWIRECQFFLYILTPHSIASNYCQAELNYANSLRKPIIPAIPETYGPEQINLPTGHILEGLHWIESKSLADFLFKLVDKICDIRIAMVGKEAVPFEDKPCPEKPIPSPEEIPDLLEHAHKRYDRGDRTTALFLSRQVRDYGSGAIADNGKRLYDRIIDENNRDASYERIKRVVEENNWDLALDFLIDHKKDYQGHDEDELEDYIRNRMQELNPETLKQAAKSPLIALDDDLTN